MTRNMRLIEVLKKLRAAAQEDLRDVIKAVATLRPFHGVALRNREILEERIAAYDAAILALEAQDAETALHNMARLDDGCYSFGGNGKR